MPDDKAQAILRDVVDRHGPFSSSADDLRRCRGFLLDLAGSHKLEINLLLRALEIGAPEQLTAGRTNLGLVTPRLVRELQETHGISAENAAWSVDAWVFALGLKTAAAEPNRMQQEAATPVPILQEHQRAAEELPHQRAAAEASSRQQTTPIWQQIGIEMVRIPAGEFLYGDDKRRIHLDEYWISKTPVTNRQYKAFVDATGYLAPIHWQTWWQNGKIPPGKEDHPVTHVSWKVATAFCQWAGLALPGEQQWEKAARGTDGRTYPWGEQQPDNQRCNFNWEVKDTTLVGKYPAGASPYGLLDMAGNVWEWCRDKWRDRRNFRVLRGGSYYSDAKGVRCAYSEMRYPENTNDSSGFRVVTS